MTKAHQITEEDVDRSSTLERSDVGRWTVQVQGTVVFCENEAVARQLAARIAQERPQQVKDWAYYANLD